MFLYATHDRAGVRHDTDSVESLLRGLEAFASFDLGAHRQAALSVKHIV